MRRLLLLIVEKNKYVPYTVSVMKRMFLLASVLAGITFVFFIARAQETVLISVFVREECGHCKDEEVFLEELKMEMPTLEITYYDLTDSRNLELFIAVTERYGLARATPVTLIRGKLLQGFDTADTTGRIMRHLIAGEGGHVRFEDILFGGAEVADSLSYDQFCRDGIICGTEAPQTVVRLPLIGKEIDVGAFSLTALSAVLGFIDGFNPCALWVLLMFLIVLAQVGSRKNMMQYAGIFILAEAVMYYLILNVWFTAWDFVKLDRIVTPLVGLLAVGSGAYFLYKFATYKDTCEVTSLGQKKSLTARAQRLAGKPFTLGVLLGILGLAFSVNVFEFACSIGIPQTFTKILELNALGWLARQGYMALYILMYMVDDFLVFGLALYSFEKIGLTHKYSKWSTLIGGLLMLALGVIMLIKPELLVF